MIRGDAVWLAVEPLDMRAGTEAALSRVVSVFGAARPHHAEQRPLRWRIKEWLGRMWEYWL